METVLNSKSSAIFSLFNKGQNNAVLVQHCLIKQQELSTKETATTISSSSFSFSQSLKSKTHELDEENDKIENEQFWNKLRSKMIKKKKVSSAPISSKKLMKLEKKNLSANRKLRHKMYLFGKTVDMMKFLLEQVGVKAPSIESNKKHTIKNIQAEVFEGISEFQKIRADSLNNLIRLVENKRERPQKKSVRIVDKELEQSSIKSLDLNISNCQLLMKKTHSNTIGVPKKANSEKDFGLRLSLPLPPKSTMEKKEIQEEKNNSETVELRPQNKLNQETEPKTSSLPHFKDLFDEDFGDLRFKEEMEVEDKKEVPPIFNFGLNKEEKLSFDQQEDGFGWNEISQALQRTSGDRFKSADYSYNFGFDYLDL